MNIQVMEKSIQMATATERYLWQRWVTGTQRGYEVCRIINRSVGLALTAVGNASFLCPICDYRGLFFPFGGRKNATCPGCGSLERHRLQRLVLDSVPERSRFHNMRVLHFAPEPFFTGFFRSTFRLYASADLSGRHVDLGADITKLPFPNESFDVVYASHVLEHVQDDRRALKEISRILKPSGMAFLPVPIFNGIKTVEYPEPVAAEAYHVRQPGYDYYDRFCEVFSKVVKYSSNDFNPEYQVYIHEDRSTWPTQALPYRKPMPGKKHVDIVPVCYK